MPELSAREISRARESRSGAGRRRRRNQVDVERAGRAVQFEIECIVGAARIAPVNSGSSGAICLPMMRILSHSPGRRFRARGVHLACDLQETILVAPDEEDLEQLQIQIATVGSRFMASCTRSAAWS